MAAAKDLRPAHGAKELAPVLVLSLPLFFFSPLSRSELSISSSSSLPCGWSDLYLAV
jgi:hypothetical protein